jgi:SAM-dependent methyltransferase
MVSTAELNGIGPHQKDAVLYWPTHREEFDQLIKAVGEITPNDFVFVDVGCGKGRVLLMASLLPFKRVIGVDFSPAMVDMAKRNVALARGARRSGAIEVVHADAAAYTFPEEHLVIFLFNPFGPRVLTKVLENLKTSLQARPRRAFLLYNNSIHGALLEHAGFRLVAEGHGGKWPWQVYASEYERGAGVAHSIMTLA